MVIDFPLSTQVPSIIQAQVPMAETTNQFDPLKGLT